MQTEKKLESQEIGSTESPMTEGEWDSLIEGVIGLVNDNREKAFEYYKVAYGKVQTWKQLSEVADGVVNRLKDRHWGIELCHEAVAKAKTGTQYCIMGEIISHPDGLNAKAWAEDVFLMALQKADSDAERKSIKDSMEECLQGWRE